jgi:hypothetical protein
MIFEKKCKIVQIECPSDCVSVLPSSSPVLSYNISTAASPLPSDPSHGAAFPSVYGTQHSFFFEKKYIKYLYILFIQPGTASPVCVAARHANLFPETTTSSVMSVRLSAMLQLLSLLS